MNFVANHPTFCHWWAMFAVLLGMGCRIGEALGLRWENLGFDNGVISINHSVVYYPVGDNCSSILHVSETKTEEGNRTIPMLDTVRDAFEMISEEQEETGRNETVIDGMTGFVFKNRFGNVPNPQSVNRAIKRIISEYNSIEEVQAKKSASR